jgi:membrane protease YdiL (CAAX protease family)
VTELPPPRPDLIGPAGPPLPPDQAAVRHPPVPRATWSPVETIPVFLIATLAAILVGASLVAVPHFCAGQVVIGTLVAELAFGAAVLYWIRYVNHGPIAAIGLPRRPLADVGAGLVGGVVLIVAGSLALYLVRFLVSLVIGHQPPVPEQVLSCVRGPALGLLGPVVVLVAPFGEELLFRGFLYKALRRNRSVAVSTLVSSVAFGLVHVHPLLIPALAVVGAGLALVYERRQSVLASMVAHATFNLLGFITIFMSRT